MNLLVCRLANSFLVFFHFVDVVTVELVRLHVLLFCCGILCFFALWLPLLTAHFARNVSQYLIIVTSKPTLSWSVAICILLSRNVDRYFKIWEVPVYCTSPPVYSLYYNWPQPRGDTDGSHVVYGVLLLSTLYQQHRPCNNERHCQYETWMGGDLPVFEKTTKKLNYFGSVEPKADKLTERGKHLTHIRNLSLPRIRVSFPAL
jgi:hypothetical protein